MGAIDKDLPIELKETFNKNTRIENDSVMKILKENLNNITMNILKRSMKKGCESMVIEIIINK